MRLTSAKYFLPLAVLLFGGNSASAQTPEPEWQLVHRAEVALEYTGIVSWDEETFGLWAPSQGRLQLMATDGALGKTVQLSRVLDPGKPQGPMFADPLIRVGNRVYWLSKAANQVAVFDPRGKFVEELPTTVGNAVSIAQTAGGGVEVFGYRPNSRYAGADAFSSEGRKVGFVESWLESQVDDRPTFLNMHLVNLGPSRFEVLTHFPFARVKRGADERVFNLLGSCTPQVLHGRFDKLQQSRGLPKPLGQGFELRGPLELAALDVATVDEGILVLMNGGYLVFVPSDPAASTGCFAVPTRPEIGGPISLARVGQSIGAILLNPDAPMTVEVWTGLNLIQK